MKVFCTRHSVAAGDDLDAPHKRYFSFADDLTLEQMLIRIRAAGYLPTISGGQASWSAASKVPIAVLAQQWDEPRILFRRYSDCRDLDMVDGTLRIHFNYHAQVDPETVQEVLRDYQDRVGGDIGA